MKLTNNNKNKQIRLDCFNVTKLYGKPANWSTSQMQTISTVRISVDYGCIDPSAVLVQLVTINNDNTLNATNKL